jgi:Flp pilus assembly pilin Flp
MRPTRLPARLPGPARRLRRLERGASLVEYALLVALIALAALTAVQFLGDSTSGSLDRSTSSLFVG